MPLIRAAARDLGIPKGYFDDKAQDRAQNKLLAAPENPNGQLIFDADLSSLLDRTSGRTSAILCRYNYDLIQLAPMLAARGVRYRFRNREWLSRIRTNLKALLVASSQFRGAGAGSFVEWVKHRLKLIQRTASQKKQPETTAVALPSARLSKAKHVERESQQDKEECGLAKVRTEQQEKDQTKKKQALDDHTTLLLKRNEDIADLGNSVLSLLRTTLEGLEWVNAEATLNVALQQLYERYERKDADLSQYVQLSTVHYSKGAQFDDVYVLRGGLECQILEIDGTDNLEELNVWFVAMTRTKENLYLLKLDGWKRFGTNFNGWAKRELFDEKDEKNGKRAASAQQ